MLFRSGGLRLSPYRIVLIACFFPAIAKLFAPRMGGRIATDWLFLGFAGWAVVSLAANHGAIGPVRFSKTKRYSGTFKPSATRPVDADTVAQFLTKLPFIPVAPAALTDEAGGDNNASHQGGFVPELSDVACGG